VDVIVVALAVATEWYEDRQNNSKDIQQAFEIIIIMMMDAIYHCYS
jgi:hypothetical protein